ncbi:hypothetical protein C5167_004413 [Papaver somniferum]|uniref:Uncharacterized protein n=1 Tax=Papaver somniferum TaxID=3469 RepID=A0A4Y7JBD7_PAPSO|nr:hypothetical protein C5167_004413 [Papaver somniferum]
MASFHVRSVSLPKTSHPITLAVEEQLCQLKATEQATSSSSISQNLSGLVDLYECVEDFLSTHDGKCLDSGLDGSIILLDVCSIAKDVLSQTKQSVQELQSSIRRRSNEVSEYMISRKKISIEVNNVQKTLKALEMSLEDLEDKLEAVFSLPKNSHPLTLAVEEQLCQLKASSSISQNLSGLKKLYECVEDFLSTQDGECLDSGLDGSIKVLDVCSIAKDVLSQMKQSVQEVQSSIRRSNEVSEYMISRKKITKVIRKCLSDLKNKKIDSESSILREVEATTLAILESLLSFVSEPKQNKSLISKLILNKRVAHKCDEETSEVMNV